MSGGMVRTASALLIAAGVGVTAQAAQVTPVGSVNQAQVDVNFTARLTGVGVSSSSSVDQPDTIEQTVEVPATVEADQQDVDITVTAQTSGIQPLHGVQELKGADLGTVGVDIAPGRGFAIMRDSPIGSGLSANQDGFALAGKPLTSFIGIGQAGQGAATSGISNVPVPGLNSVPILNLPVVGGILNMR